ncbi:hypothetical protein AMC83_PA00070 (plasmid) [Rhizobium phaseoli]|uniref:antitoxin VbhA family protein n=1 Tax=Rhizobium phaseoli TaxID=396 RepID=UPI0007E94969|nr:antitoxin VbhA family protein [Rhizobium phaseoli]ANL74297.1 hypothetical protein AMC83_PA00070 [Rhizobium phaseoli]
MPRKPFVPTPEEIVADVVANNRLSGYEVPEDIKEILLQIARGETSADDAIANLERGGRRLAFEKVDKMEPFAHVPSTPEGEAIRARWIAGEITAEEAIAAFDEEIRKITE